MVTSWLNGLNEYPYDWDSKTNSLKLWLKLILRLIQRPLTNLWPTWTKHRSPLSVFGEKDWSKAPMRIDPIEIQKNGFFLPNQNARHITTFHAVMKPIIILGQLFSLNPVVGICNLNPSKLRFTYFSGRCAYTVLTFICQVIFLNIFFVIKLIKDSDTKLIITSLVFYTSNTVTTILFLQIATKWPKLSQYIARTEAADPLYDATLKTKCKLSCILILVLALGEYIVSNIAGYVTAVDCDPERVYQRYITQKFPWIDVAFSYSNTVGVLMQLLNIQCTFTWNFTDLFVICISFYLTSRLEQINKKIKANKGKCVPASFWRIIREDYNRLTSLVKRMNDVIGTTIFMSFANNIFFVCLQLLHTLSDGVKATPSCSKPDTRILHGYEHAVYYTYSLVFLILRATAVSLIASRVNTASTEPASALYDVSSKVYCIEIQRLIEQIHGDTVALTGLEFFKVRREILLAIAGTIVTYELVLMQFTGTTPAAAPLRNTSELMQ